ncbi:MAG TPA: cyclic nucleotide-binding domain-containing protein, partial [Gemmatimonadales bacterium]|nr:cyclic nucleotide-binding domain-containing protein [Gemmatimonadales bacterium]
MTATTVPPKTTAEAFPRLTAAQIGRIEPRGRRRHVAAGEILGEMGEPVTRIFVVVSGRLDLVRPPRWVGEEVPSFSEGMFTGERSILAGGRFLVRIQASTPCDVIE